MSDTFNKAQRQALDSPLGIDLMISAGAGSGKTKTLTEKVYKIIAEDNISPSSILVLTFTNNAAYEMKERIIERFALSGSDKKDEIMSSHIQTFDALSLYLVKKYSSLLGIPDNVNVIDEALLTSKRCELLDEIIEEYCQIRDKRMITLINKFAYKDEQNVKDIILKLDKDLDKMGDKEKEDFILNYNSRYLSISKLDSFFSSLVLSIKNKVNDAYLGLEKELPLETEILSREKELLGLNEGNTPDDTFACLKLYKALTKANKTRKSLDDESNACYESYAAIIKNLKEDVGKYDLIDNEKETLLSFKDDISFIFEIITKLDFMLDEYMKENNSYTFTRIAKMSLSLLVEDKYEVARKELQSRFKYVLVDEYQDTSPLQETFINIISSNATLFVVGDVKQSIYRFRSADCTLFTSRKEKYLSHEKDNTAIVLMNNNYRSYLKIITDVNKVFKGLMTVDNGGVNYSAEEELVYDYEVDLYNEKKLELNGEYGLNLIDYVSLRKEAKTTSYQDALTIAQSILSHIKNKYQVYDYKIKGNRDCTYKDFAILVKRATNIDDYKEVFMERGIPLNVKDGIPLSEANAIITLESLLKAIYFFMTDDNEINIKHIYASLARSYLYNKTDEEIYLKLMDDFENTYQNINIFVDIAAFTKENASYPLSKLFNGLVNHFGVMSSLSRLGDVTNNVSKIESLYKVIKTIENTGGGLKDFILFVDNINKYSISFEAESVSYTEDAVEITTIHKSKGLEYRIIYLPVFDNGYTYQGDSNSLVGFSLDYGISLPDLKVGSYKYTMLMNDYIEKDKKEAKDEYIRLIYVAFTRAKETIYIVGHPASNTKKGDYNLYSILEKGYEKELIINDELLNKSIKNNVITKDQYLSIKECVKDINYYNKKVKSTIISKYLLDQTNNKIKELISTFKKQIKEVISLLSLYYQDKYEALPITDKKSFFSLLDEDIINYYLSLTDKGYSKLDLYDLIFYFEGIRGAIYHYGFDGIPLTYFYSDEPLLEGDRHENKDIILNVNDDEIKVDEIKEERASKKHVEGEEDSNVTQEGTHFHELLELTDFKKKDTSFIKDIHEKEIIDKVISNPFFDDISNYDVYKEYEYLRDDGGTGFVDLLLVGKDIKIIDYKLKNIDDSAYINQLQTYKKYISKLFMGKEIKTYLLSIVDNSIKEV